MGNVPPFIENLHNTFSHSPILFFYAVHFIAGRPFAILAGLWVGLPPRLIVPLAWAGDMLHIPFFAAIYDLAERGLRFSSYFARLIDRGRAYLDHKKFYNRFRTMGALGVIVIAATPMWGCGMWSAVLLAWTMRMKRLPGTIYLSIGSLAGSILVIGLVEFAKLAWSAF